MTDRTDPRLDVYAAPQRLVDVGGGRRLNLHVTGDGPVTVILAAGFLGLTLDWVLVQGALSRLARVVSFDNAGLGFSDRGPEPRTTAAIVTDLRAALAAVQIGPPYILVGHSAGSLRMRRFAVEWPHEVRGLVMVDPVTADWEQRLYGGRAPIMAEEEQLFRRFLDRARAGTLHPDDAEVRARTGLPNPRLTARLNAALARMWTDPDYLETAISEGREIGGPADAAFDSSLGDLPLIVLSAERIAESPITGGDPSCVAAWFAMHDEIAAASRDGRRQMVDAGHNIPIEAPKAVIDAVAPWLRG